MDAGLYIHIPFCESKCFYCDFYSGHFNEETREKYVLELINEIKSIGEKTQNKTIKTVYFGGGTPTVLSMKQLSAITEAVYKYYKTDISEFSIETNPNIEVDFSALKSMGINRLSIGVQSLNDELLKKIGRRHNAQQAKRCLNLAREHFQNISADLMLGLSENQDVKSDLLYLLQMTTHLSTYILKLEDKTPLKRFVENKSVAIATENSVICQYNEVLNICEENNFKRYEVSNFSLPDYQSKHNSFYWNLTDYYGVGASAHSYVDGRRYYNQSSISEYLKGRHSGNNLEEVERDYSIDAEKEEFIMLSLRTTIGLNLSEYTNRFNENLLVAKATEIKLLSRFIEITDDFLRIKREYFLVQNSIISELI